MSRLSPDVQATLRAATISEDGLTLTLGGQLERKLYTATAKAIEALGGKWNRKAGAHLFTTDVRTILARVLDGEKLPDKNPLDFFATPVDVVLEMCRRIWPWASGARFLEPSAGTGAIADYLWSKHRVQADCVELDAGRAQALRDKQYPVVASDFLAFTPAEPYDYVVMNPPFTAPGDRWAYITHIEHALTCLKPGGQLVAVVPQGYVFGSAPRVAAFRAFCEAHAQSPLHQFAPDTFKASGTSVATALIHITKPEPQEAAMTATETPAQPKKSRRSKQDTVPTEPADFKAMAEATRAKMQASHERGKALGGMKGKAAEPAPSDTDLPFPVSEAQLEAASTEGQPFAAAAAEPIAASFPVGSRVRFEDGLGVSLDGIVDQHLQDTATCLIAAPVESGPPQHYARAYTDLQLVALPGTLAAKVLRDLVPGELIGEMQSAPATEPLSTPDVLVLDDLAPGTLGLHAVPLHLTARSGCNVRHHYDPAAIEELAASLRAEGQIENATGRWNADGVVEIVAGESRRRAQLLRQDAGETGLALIVNIRELTDAEALSISATENMRRRQMTALEECEAMHRLNEAGRSVEEIQAMFGYKSAQPVADRILVAKNLHTTPRELLDRGELSLACAMVIARAPGQDLQLSMTQDATRSWNRATATELSKRLTQGQFLVTEARFDVDTSGLQVKRDLFDAFEPYFEDKAAALNLQIQWAQARADKLRQKGKQEFVHVVTDGSFDRYGRVYYGHAGAGRGGYVITVSPQTGAVKEHDQVLLRPGKSVTTDETGKSKVESVKPMPDSAYLAAHQMRATAARTTILGNNHLTLAMAVWGLVLGGSDSGVGRVNLTSVNREHAPIPALEERAEALGQLLAPYTSGTSVHIAALSVSGVRPDPARLLERLIAMTDEELLGHLNTLIARSAYDWSQYNNKDAAKPEYALLASLTGAAAHLAQSFKLTDEWLKRYPRQDLVTLAEEAGLGRALVEDCGTLKEMRARILEHADQLHAAGFVPRLLQFPAPPAPATTATAAD